MLQNPTFQFFLFCLTTCCYAGTILIVLTNLYFGVMDGLDKVAIGLFFFLGVLTSFNIFLKDFDKWISKD